MLWLTLEHPETDEELEVRVYVQGPSRGERDCYGAPLEPDDQLEWEVCDVWDSHGNQLTADELNALRTRLDEQVERHLKRMAYER